MAEIVLDRKTFEALAIDTRINILKSLKKRRKTGSELANEMGLAVSTVSEHLDKMLEAGLVRRKEQGKKWVYYELTEKGTIIVSPKKTSVFVFALTVSLFMLVFSIYLLNAGQMTLVASGEHTPTPTYEASIGTPKSFENRADNLSYPAGGAPAAVGTEEQNESYQAQPEDQTLEPGTTAPSPLTYQAAKVSNHGAIFIFMFGVFLLILGIYYWVR